MIIYATRQTFDSFKMTDELAAFSESDESDLARSVRREKANDLHKWGAKLFAGEKKPSLLVCNYASKLTLFLFDVKSEDIKSLAEKILTGIFELYKDDAVLLDAVNKMYGEKPATFVSRITDKRIISTLNRVQTTFINKPDFPAAYKENGTINMTKLNNAFNLNFLVSDRINGKTEYIFPTERFRELVLAEYGTPK